MQHKYNGILCLLTRLSLKITQGFKELHRMQIDKCSIDQFA